ncbi:hypothetical protein AO501_25125 [Mycobacterium gordonae]|uniref:Uncharacterized protein n=1 Tax=Mycobacterium gordonae TaxID=1778 RepID=A0A0Q2LIE3_MYCGO|nr:MULTISPECIES: hypothetical protein [Mycobacterium]KQH75562.1 hypothetical protein AO501_25125 [Mycobacterium gordonae]MDP7732123.1 hypothetical protein [Mycobacterium sp. TY813]
MDLAETIIPRSDQINSEDLLTGPRTITITAVKRGTDEQPVDIVTAEFGPARPYKPSKTMRRVLVAAWGTDAQAYVGRRLVIYRDPEITFGKDKVGGIRISAMSDISARLSVALTVTRGRRAPFIVEPLPSAGITAADAADFERRIADANTIQDLDAIGRDLKARDLGSHRGHLQSAWKDRRAAVTSSVSSPQKEDAGKAEAAADVAPAEPSPADVTMATPQQLKRLNAIRQAEKWEADDEWRAYVQALTGAEVAADGQLTETQAQAVIDEFGADQ